MISIAEIERARAQPIEAEIARRGVRLRGSIERTGPCPTCGGSDRFSINARKQIWNCRGCGKGGDVIDLVMHLDGCTFGQAVALLAGESSERPQAEQSRQNQREREREHQQTQARKAAGLWAHRRPIMGSIAETYLRRRGITGPLPFATLGFLPPRTPDHHPAMIACFGLHDEPEPGVLGLPRGIVDSVHLTLLKPDGSDKAEVEHPKLIVGSPRGRPIELAPANDLLGLAITEGIEDALTIHQSTGLGAWAAGSAPHLPKLADAVPNWMDCITIYAHVDADEAGQKGALALATALKARGFRDVVIEGL